MALITGLVPASTGKRSAKAHSIAYVKLPVAWRNKVAAGSRGLDFEAAVAVTLMLEAEGKVEISYKPGFEARRDELAKFYTEYIAANKAE